VTRVGSVLEVWRFPVKSMLGERIVSSAVDVRGLRWDRSFAVIDAEGGKVVSAKMNKRFPSLFRFNATVAEGDPASGRGPMATIRLPDGSTATTADRDVDAVLSRAFGRAVVLASASPESYIRRTRAVFAQLFPNSPAPQVPEGLLVDAFPVSIITSSTLAELTRHRPQSRFDSRRFRMNLVIDTDTEGFVENEWIGRILRVGDAVRLRIALPDSRCLMTTLSQEELPHDDEVLRTMEKHNRVMVAGSEEPCAGVYATVESSGVVKTGDPVVLE
jgi:uncharacterized protein